MAMRLRNKSTLVAVLGILILGMILLGSLSIPAATAQSRAGEGLQSDLRVVYLAEQTDQPGVQIPAPSYLLRANAPQTANINVTYTGAWPGAAQTAFNFAVTIWEGLITSGVTIEVLADWAPLGAGVLGSAGTNFYWRNFPNAPVGSTWYPDALADKLAGSDRNPGQPDINATFNSNFADWYFGTDANPPGNQWDFVSVVLHEIGHGLGFAGSMRVGGTCGGSNGCWGLVGDANNDPVMYDRFTENGSGTPLLNFTNFSTGLASELTSGDIFFDGANANGANSGNPPELFAPAGWQQGSSYSHLDETVFNGTPNALMTPSIANGEANHNPGAIVLGMFGDMGWMIDGATATPSGPTNTPPGPTSTPGGPTPTPSNFLPVIMKQLNVFANPVQDPGFETGSPNAFWAEASTNFGTPICSVATCGVNGAPRSGTFWVWFGGIAAYEEGSVTQNVTMPNGTANLEFYLQQPACDSTSDYMEILVDGSLVYLINGASGLCGGLSYALQTVNLNSFADGGVHALQFHSEIFSNNNGISNFFVDDIAITP